MNKDEIMMHLAAGRYYGKVSTCGTDSKPKIKHDSEEKANRHAKHLNDNQPYSHVVEAYPCYWCSPDKDNGVYLWHVGRMMTNDERIVFSSEAGEKLLEMEDFVIDSAADSIVGAETANVTLRVHNRKYCEGQYCSIHNPSDHHMNTWPLNWRGDRRIMERVCIHGVGHPDPDDAYYRRHRDDGDEYDNGTHGCDGCCVMNKTEWLVRNYGT